MFHCVSLFTMTFVCILVSISYKRCITVRCKEHIKAYVNKYREKITAYNYMNRPLMELFSALYGSVNNMEIEGSVQQTAA